MNLSLGIVGVFALLSLGGLTAYRVEKTWRQNVEVELAKCEGQLAGLSARDRARERVDPLNDPADELLRRYGR